MMSEYDLCVPACKALNIDSFEFEARVVHAGTHVQMLPLVQ